jgi:teichuronic acid biosynthesis glycosyltransferase TuaG
MREECDKSFNWGKTDVAIGDVSVVIPNWNRAGLLEKAVRSTLVQTLPPLEVLVCDDGSTDESQNVIESLGDDRVRWIEGARAGRPAVPRNGGIRASKGEWVAFLDNDDEWFPHKLEKQLLLAQQLGCDAVCSNAFRLVSWQKEVENYLAWKCERITFQDLLRLNLVICSSAVVRRSVFSTVLGFPESEQLKALEDYALWLRVLTQTDFAYVTEPLLVYRDDPANSIRSHDMNEWRQRRAVLTDFGWWSKQEMISPSYLYQVKRQLMADAICSLKSTLTTHKRWMTKAFFQ